MKREDLLSQIKELKIQLEEVKSLSEAKERLLLEALKELEGLYSILREKIKEIREKDRRLKGIDESLTRLDRLTSLGELALSIAHEIKNPLIVIEGFAKRIQKEERKERVIEYANIIDKEAERLSALLRKMLEFSKPLEPKRESVSLMEVIEDTRLFLEHHLSRFKNVEVFLEGSDYIVHVDRIHIQQILVNLIMNAAQAMEHGGKILIRLEREGDYVIISIKDEGPGIPEELKEKIFEPFFTTKEGGTGLGLSICRRLIEANSGKIEVESEPGRGSTFKVFLPIQNSGLKEEI